MGSGVLGPKTYQYQSLGEMEFRLVRILPERMSKLKCEIVHQSLDDAPDYVAISYAWGDGVDTKLLILEGASVPITGSLYDALKAVRQKKQETLVWVDALCIDQNNRDERATQVRLMGLIYSKATSVAIWLGPEANKSTLAMQLLQQVADNTVSKQRVQAVRQYADSEALLALFKKRDYWKRLWVVQEVLLAEKKMVYCGYSVFPWETYRQAAEAFWPPESDPHIRHGPSSFPDKSLLAQLGDESLLEVMRACRRKLSENPRDKVFGILGMLPEDTQREFPVDYSQSVKTVYTDVVDYTISTSDRLDVIRESIHFPLHVNTLGLPSWCPDWSHIPEVSGLGRTHGFEASRSAEGPTEARYRFYDERRKLKISAIKLDTVNETGVAVGTFCASQDYLTAFLDWRAIMLHEFKIEEGNESHPMHEAFCRTLCLGQMPEQQYDPKIWRDLCYHTFSSLIRERLPRLPIDEDLARYVAVTGLIEPTAQRKFLQDHFGNRMMGRSFCITEQGLVGMGCGYMMADDIIVVPFGCSTPILLRADGCRDEYRYIGDIYVDGYMHGEAVQEMEANDPRRIPADYMLI
ncbi:HET-domain-containing protein [Ophiobolus disseminans]|uniref:HET-domain-containing protein n=1 Tax=Ophiobolus disseminans TaxID=1469910 RepID=A0A6A7ABG9_9PLEO|nr:HET-domain-containing protein [Ophiobolus disseminans]